jgi:hypothetical protein
MVEDDFKAAAERAMNGQNDTLWLAIHDRLHRAPTSIAECQTEIKAMSHYERVCYGAQDWSDDTKQRCSGCGSDYHGAHCGNCGAGLHMAAHA